MSGTGGAEVLAGGPPEGAGGPVGSGHVGRSTWPGLAVVAVLGALVGAVGTSVLGGAGASPPSTTATSPTPSVPSSGVVIPEVVDAQTLPASGNMEVVAEAVPGASTPGPLRYDYSLVGAAWLAPDGTVRAGPPGCVRPADQVQYLQVAVVHARAVAGGPDTDRVVWFRCSTAPQPPKS